jgi:hypothetical protein
MKIFQKSALWLSVFTLASGIAFAGNPDRAGQAGATQLLVNPWARSSGLGGVNMAGIHGLEALSFNAGGLTGKQSTEFGFAHTNWLVGSGISLNAFGLCQKIGANKTNALGLSITSFDFGDMVRTTTFNPEGNGTFKLTIMHLSLGYGHEFSDNISGGVIFKVVSEGIADAKAQGLGIDAGIQYKTGFQDKIKFGVALRNIGPKMRYNGDGLSTRGMLEGTDYTMTLQVRSSDFEMPSVLHISGSYDLMNDSMSTNRLTLSGSFFANSFARNQLGLGLEYGWRNMVMLRAGYLYEDKIYTKDQSSNTYRGPSVGVTVELPFGKPENRHSFAIDYSYRAAAPFSGTHTFGARLGL